MQLQTLHRQQPLQGELLARERFQRQQAEQQLKALTEAQTRPQVRRLGNFK